MKSWESGVVIKHFKTYSFSTHKTFDPSSCFHDQRSEFVAYTSLCLMSNNGDMQNM